MASHQSLAQQIQELKLKQTAGTITAEELNLLEQLEEQYAELLEQGVTAEELAEIAEAATAQSEELVSIPDIGFVTPAAGLGLAALGAGGSGSGASGGTLVSNVDTTFSGQLVNGYIKDARVFQDNNGNGEYDAGEPTGVTDGSGRFSLDGYLAGGGPVIAQPTWIDASGNAKTAVDQKTGATVSTVFSAPAGAEVISPLSTLVSAGATEAEIKAAFNIDNSVDLLAFNPIAAAEEQGASAADIEIALKVKAASTAVSNLLDIASESLVHLDVDSNTATQAAASAIADKLTLSGFSLADASIVEATLNQTIANSGAQLDASTTTALTNSLGTKLADVNTAIFDAATNTADPAVALQTIYKASKTAQVTLTSYVADVIEADDPTSAISSLDGLDIDATIAAASVPNNNAFGGLDFELEASEYSLDFFEGANGKITTDPTDDSNTVVEFIRTPDSKHYSGVTLGYLSGNTVGEILVDSDAGETTINARIWSPTSGIVARMEIADTSAMAEQNLYFNVHADATLEAGWNDVVFDFANPVVRYVDETNGSLATPISPDATYDKLSLFIDWENGKDYPGNEVGEPITDNVSYYIDNVILGFGEPEFYSGGATNDSNAESNEPTAAPDAPTADAADVISLFSDSYTAATTANWSTDWDSADVADVDLGGNTVKKYTNVSFIGIEPAATVDASASDTFNLSVWRTDATADLKIKLVEYASGSWNADTNVEHEINLAAGGDDAVAAGQWVDLSLSLSDFTGLTSTGNIGQIIISSHKYDENGDPVGSGETLYIDNMYFGADAVSAPAEPTAAPDAPTADAADVISLFSDSYTAATTANWSTDWDSADVADVDLGGNTVKKYTNVSFIGIEPAATVDASASDTFNLSVWRTDATADLKIKLVEYASGSWNADTNVEHEINLAAGGDDAVAAGQWVDLSLSLSDFTGLTSTGNIGQIIISSHKYDENGDPVGSGETLYIDNMYFGSSVEFSQSPASSADLTGYSLVFEDEFNAVGESPDSANWTFDEGNDGWGNNEVQDYQSDLNDAQIIDWDASSAVNGALRITAQNVDGTITSARVKSDIDVGPYGYYEVRAKLPSEAGAWPAIWLLGEGGRSNWPEDGEIDLVEWSSAYASGDTEIISALHYPAAHGGNANDTTTTLTSAVDEWHTYQLWWTPESIKIGVDGTEADAHLVYTKPDNATNNTWPYDGPMDLILNIAIGGTLGGTVPSENFQYAMDIDYVRIYQIDGTAAGAAPTELTLSFDETDGSGFALTDFGGNASSIVSGLEAPTGSDGSVIKVQKTAGAQTWAGTTFFELTGDGELVSDGGTLVTAEVFSAKDGASIRLKLEDSTNENVFIELDAVTESNGSDAWESLTWDLSTAEGFNQSDNYDKATIFFDFGNAGDDEVYYFDNVNFNGYSA